MHPRHHCGYILIFVLWILVSLSFLALTFMRGIRSNLQLSASYIDQAKELYAARGAALYAVHKLDLVRVPLNQEGRTSPPKKEPEKEDKAQIPLPPILRSLPMFKNLFKEEAGKPQESERLSENKGKISSASGGSGSTPYPEEKKYWEPSSVPYKVSIGNTEYSVLIACENGKLNINMASPEILKNLFYQKGLSLSQIEILVDSIQDWIDPDDNRRLNGAENAYYESLPQPYKCKNAPLQNIEELLRVRGMTKQLFEAIRQDITVFSDGGRININFASKQLLNAIPGMTAPLTEEIIRLRQRKGPFTSLDQIRELSEISFSEIEKYITVEKGQFLSIKAGRDISHPRVEFIVGPTRIIAVYLY